MHEPWQGNEVDEARKSAYCTRLADAKQRAAALHHRERRFGPLRLVVFLAFVWALFEGLVRGGATPAWLLAPVLGFVAFLWTLRRHGQIRASLARAQFDAAEYERGIERLAPTGNQAPGREAMDPSWIWDAHLADDLDLHGPNSLYGRINRAQTSAGQEILARWMTTPVQTEAIEQRQSAVRELEPLLDWRHELAAACATTKPVRSDRLIAAFERPGLSPQQVSRALAIVACLALLGLGAMTWAVASGGPIEPRFFVVLAVMVMSGLVHRSSAIPAVPGSDRMSQQLASLRALSNGLAHLEGSSFQGAYLRERLSLVALRPGQAPSSARLKRYANLYAYLELGRTQFVAIPLFFVVWLPLFSLLLERERQRVGQEIAQLVKVLGEMETLSSLGCYAFEQPQDVYPDYQDHALPILEIDQLRHPLLGRRVAVRNPVRASVGAAQARSSSARPDNSEAQGSDHPALFMISGSNMSGKSTYLRSIGLALVLGRMGTKVPATRMQSSNWRLASHLRSQDSLAQGLSRFGAEVARVAKIIQEARKEAQTPFLFLIDEVFSGTNSHDRRIAVDSLIEELVKQRCVGWITTHDLALTTIADTLAPLTANQHFEDQFDESHMAFDYRLRPGVVKKSNALALMRHAGLLTSPAKSSDRSPGA